MGRIRIAASSTSELFSKLFLYQLVTYGTGLSFGVPAYPPVVRAHHGITWLLVLTAYRLLDPGSEWRLHRHWFEHSAIGDLLGEDFAIVAKDTL